LRLATREVLPADLRPAGRLLLGQSIEREEIGMSMHAFRRVALGGLAAVAALVVPAVAWGSGYGYVWADQPAAASYTPSSFYQTNSKGGTNTITRTSPGRYSVNFPKLASPGNGGTVNVTAYGGSANACEVTGWGGNGADGILVGVLCTDTNGTPVDSYFDATYDVPAARGKLGYVWANSPTAASYTPSAFYQFNSQGFSNTIDRFGTGSYVVHLPGLGSAKSGGTVKVTAYGGSANRCKVTSWGPNGTGVDVGIQCYTAAGVPVDAYYTMTFVQKRNLLGSGKGYGYAWADQPTSASYTPSTFYSKTNPIGPISITRSSVGVYSVNFQSVGTAYLSDVQVTAYGGGSNECRVGGWSPNGGGQTVTVYCNTTTGAPVDTYYTIQFIR
jgi:hypothetical protein